MFLNYLISEILYREKFENFGTISILKGVKCINHLMLRVTKLRLIRITFALLNSVKNRD
jgi:hypothetical protein